MEHVKKTNTSEMRNWSWKELYFWSSQWKCDVQFIE